MSIINGAHYASATMMISVWLMNANFDMNRLREYATTQSNNDPLLQGWEGQNIWLEPMGGRCCVII
jgi:hypothetical protein